MAEWVEASHRMVCVLYAAHQNLAAIGAPAITVNQHFSPLPHTHPPKAAPRRSGNLGEILGNQTTTTASPGSSPWKSLSPSTPGGWVGGWSLFPCTAVKYRLLWYNNWYMNFLRFLLLHNKYSIFERTHNNDATVPISKLALPSSRKHQRLFLTSSSARYSSGNSQPNKLCGI